jgi:hypothetical protein
MGKLRQLLVYAGVIIIGLTVPTLHLPSLTANTSNVAVDPRLAVHHDLQNYEPIKVCNRVAPLLPGDDIRIMRKYSSCPLLNNPPDSTTILLLDNKRLFGRTGNNLIEFFHSLQYGRDKGFVVGMMQDSWPTRMITEMWMAIQQDDIGAWSHFIEQSFCVRVFESSDELIRYREVIQLDTRTLYYYEYEGSRDEYIEFVSQNIRALWRSYNNGTGVDAQLEPVRDMCSAVDAIFGNHMSSLPIKYSVVHSRSLERFGITLMKVISEKFGSDPIAAREMLPEYVKAILEPLGMLNHTIIFMTDNQRPEVYERLLTDPDIGPYIELIPSEASWTGGDITLALLANVFIGNPASTFSGFIANSRVALGYNHSYMYRKREENGTWVDVCDYHCSFGQYLGTG